MPYELLNLVLTIIAVKLKGGLEKFKDDGGCVTFTPETPTSLLVYHPNLPQDIKDDITKVIVNFPIKFVSTPNFAGRDADEAREALAEFLRSGVLTELRILDASISVSQALVAIRLESGILLESTASELVKRLHERLPDVVRICVVYPQGYIYKEFGEETPERKTVLVPQSQRTTVISDDDVLNVKIALENATTVEDLLRSL
jgi:hypothetical protein